jgi:MSHA biogenesis protein MshK
MRHAWGILFGLCVSGAVAAQDARLVDPTRPPQATSPAPGSDQARPAPGPQLQSVLISPNRRVAVINGQTVRQGDRVGDATVVKIDESSVHLRTGRSRQTLHLLPDVAKRDRHASAQAQSDTGTSR